MGKQVLCVVAVVMLVATLTPQCQATWGWTHRHRPGQPGHSRFRQSGQVLVLGHICHYNQVKFYDTTQDLDTYRGIIVCPGWTSIIGQAVTTDETKVKDDTISDFAQKALKAGVITEDQAKEITGQ